MGNPPGKIKILFMVSVDAQDTNAQSLNAREIVLRLDPERFESTLFYEHSPDERLLHRPSVRLVRMPRRARTLFVLKEMLRRPDVIAYVDYSPASYLFLHLPKVLRQGTVTVSHVEAPASALAGAPAFFRWLYKGILPRCEVHTGITDFIVREVAESQGVGAQFILPVGVDTRMFAPPPARNSTVPTVLFTGTVMERKGPHLVVEAAKQLPQAVFWIVGAARDGFDLVVWKRCEELGVSNVRFHGPLPQTSLAALMQRSDIFLLPSRLEGLPKVTLEAAATGLPCVVFRDYETPSVVEGITGFQVGSFEEMVSRLKLLIENRELRLKMGAAAVEHVKKFDWDVVAPQWQQAYLQVAAEHLPKRVKAGRGPA
ncbi:MAG: glycosyltransferase family 4 protein [Acidobacteriia bacterium]|nr:glycosyltransferase family 4 protein [Terriglobia bacterium]